MELFKLFGRIMINNDEANESLDKTGGKAEKTGGKLGKMAKGFAVGAAAVGAAAVAAGGAMIGLAQKTGDYSDRILDLNSITGMSTDAIQEWQQAAKVAGVPLETVTAASEKLTKTMNILEKGTGKQADAMKGLGLSFKDLNKASPDKRMEMVTEALAGIKDPAERARLGTDLLGNSWKDLAPMVSMGAEGMADAREQAHELGAVLSNDALNDANNFRIAWENMKTSLSGAAMQIGAKVAPVLTTVLIPAVNAVVPAIIWLADKAGEMVQFILEGVQKVVDGVKAWAGDNDIQMSSIKEAFQDAFSKIVEAAKIGWEFFKTYILPIFMDLFKWVQGHMPTIRSTIQTVFGKIKEVASMVWAFYRDNLLPILANLYVWIRENMPKVQSIVERVFGIIADVVKIAWGIFENFLLPALKKLWDWVSPHLPKIGKVIETAFNTIFKVVDKVVGVFESVTGAIQTAVSWLDKWNNKEAKKKDVSVSRGDYSIPRNYTGTQNFKGGLTWAGEHGPELISLPKGSKIASANDSRGMMGNTFNFEGMMSGATLVVREEADIEKIARKLGDYVKMSARKGGVVLG